MKACLREVTATLLTIVLLRLKLEHSQSGDDSELKGQKYDIFMKTKY